MYVCERALADGVNTSTRKAGSTYLVPNVRECDWSDHHDHEIPVEVSIFSCVGETGRFLLQSRTRSYEGVSRLSEIDSLEEVTWGAYQFPVVLMAFAGARIDRGVISALIGQ